MKLHNTLSKKIENFKAISDKEVRIYSCGPTVYDHIHVGNLSSFIAADTLHRALTQSGYRLKHIMNFTDVDDKTIAKSREQFPDDEPTEALKQLTEHYGQIFENDMKLIGNKLDELEFVKATDNIENMQKLIKYLHEQGFAYIAEDGVYFSIEAYVKSGKKYGQLTTINAKNTGHSRITNDEYAKDNVHDFVLWKSAKSGEPSWDFELDGRNLAGRPGWHVECSVMSTSNLGQPFDIHTGGVDLIFPHHENEIAQSTAGHDDPIYAKYFVHNEHLLVDGEKMSKSLNNFYTLRDIIEKGYDPLAFRLMVLQSHYRNQSNFTWENLDAAQNRLKNYRAIAALQFQLSEHTEGSTNTLKVVADKIKDFASNDLDTVSILALLNEVFSKFDKLLIESDVNNNSYNNVKDFVSLLQTIDDLLGLDLLKIDDITDDQKALIKERETARNLKHWDKSDEIREKLKQQGIGLNDTERGAIWYWL